MVCYNASQLCSALVVNNTSSPLFLITGVSRPEVAWFNLLFRGSHDLPIMLSDHGRNSRFLQGNNTNLFRQACILFSSCSDNTSVSSFTDHVLHYSLIDLKYGQCRLNNAPGVIYYKSQADCKVICPRGAGGEELEYKKGGDARREF